VAAAAPRLTLMEGSWLELLDSDRRDKMAVEAEEKNEDIGIRFFCAFLREPTRCSGYCFFKYMYGPAQ
jgi:hypothetical protein